LETRLAKASALREETRYGVRVRGTAPDAGAFTLGPARSRVGVLLLHGFTGSPFEVRLLGESLAGLGHAVEGPLLAGHCAPTVELANSRWPDWLRTADAALDRLGTRADKRVVCGLSMGALLTLELARRRPNDLAAICALAPALLLPRPALRLVAMTRRLPMVRSAALPKIAGSDILDPEMRRLNGIAQGNAWMPLAALTSLVDLGVHVRAHLAEVQHPILLAHSRNDHTVPFASMEAVAREISTPRRDVRQLILDRSYHVITLDVERETVFHAVAEHIREYTH
jgi:carboxylesterase